jgi:hypothetical protein
MALLNTDFLKTKPSIKTIGFGLVGTLFFGALAYLLIKAKMEVHGVDYNTGMTIKWVFIGVFIFFSIGSLFSALNIKTVVLTNNNLIIKRPLFLLKTIIPLSNIKSISEGPLKIKTSYRYRNYNIYDGQQITIEFFSGKTIKLNSYEISDFTVLTIRLNKYLSNNRSTKSNEDEDLLQNKFSGFGFLIFLILITFGLIYSLLKQKLAQ